MATRTLRSSILFAVAMVFALPAYSALGQAKKVEKPTGANAGITPYSVPKEPMGPSKKSKESYRSFNLTLPLVTLSRQAKGQLEYNMGGAASIGLEGARLVRGEELPDQEVEESGDSLETEAVQAALLISRYSNPSSMSGFFWSLGVGYRKVNAFWRGSPEVNKDEEDSRMSLLDTKGKLSHDLEISGTTGHGRMGWRYVGQSFPVLFGIHIGVRHFNSTIKDVEDSKLESETLKITPTTAVEKKNLKRRLMTALEPGVEFGVAF